MRFVFFPIAFLFFYSPLLVIKKYLSFVYLWNVNYGCTSVNLICQLWTVLFDPQLLQMRQLSSLKYLPSSFSLPLPFFVLPIMYVWSDHITFKYWFAILISIFTLILFQWLYIRWKVHHHHIVMVFAIIFSLAKVYPLGVFSRRAHGNDIPWVFVCLWSLYCKTASLDGKSLAHTFFWLFFKHCPTFC